MDAKKFTQEYYALIALKIENWIKDYFGQFDGAKKAVIGISGGKDSTVCAALLAKALGPERVVGVMMPNGEQKDISDSEKVIELLGIKRRLINIGGTYEALRQQFLSDGLNPDEVALFTTNTPARLRMTTLYGVAAVENGLVCNTCNLSEDYIGYSTKYGDAAGDFSLLNRLTKTEVVGLGDYLGLPKELVHKTPSDGMCGKSDEDNLGFTYDELDRYIENGQPSEIAREKLKKILSMHNNPNTKYKCVQMPSALEDMRSDAFLRNEC